MNEHSGFASLTSSLLARKGTARPAMRSPLQVRSGHGAIGSDGLSALSGHDDLGWNDMHGEQGAAPELQAVQPGAEPQVRPAPPSKPSVAQLQQAITDRLAHLASRAAAQGEQAAAPVLPVKPAKLAPVDVAAKADAQKAVAGADVADAPRRQSALATGRRAAFTLRLDADRHLKLRLACTLHGRSAQMLITEALDRLIAEEPALCALAAQMPNRS